MSWADKSVKIWQNLLSSNPKPDLHNINAYTKFGENPLMFTQVIIRKRKTAGRTTDGRTDGWTDRQTVVQRETIIPGNYLVVGYIFVWIQHCCLSIRVFALDPSNSVINRLQGALKWGPPREGGTCSLVPLKKIVIFSCSPKSKSWFSMFPVPQNCLCFPVSFSFIFPCSLEINDLIPLFPKTPWRASKRDKLTIYLALLLLVLTWDYRVIALILVNIVPSWDIEGC